MMNVFLGQFIFYLSIQLATLASSFSFMPNKLFITTVLSVVMNSCNLSSFITIRVILFKPFGKLDCTLLIAHTFNCIQFPFICLGRIYYLLYQNYTHFHRTKSKSQIRRNSLLSRTCRNLAEYFRQTDHRNYGSVLVSLDIQKL